MDGGAIFGQLPAGVSRIRNFGNGAYNYKSDFWFEGNTLDHDPRPFKWKEENEPLKAVPLGLLMASGSLDHIKCIGTSRHYGTLTVDRLKQAGVNIVDFEFV